MDPYFEIPLSATDTENQELLLPEDISVDFNLDDQGDYLLLDSDGDGFSDLQEGRLPLIDFASGTLGQADAFDPHTRGFFQIVNVAVVDGQAYPAGQLFLVDPVDGGMTPIGDASNVGVRINGAGFDEATGFIYGIVQAEDPDTPAGGFDALGNELSLGDIVRYDRDGEVFKVADGERNLRPHSGDVYDGKLYLHSHTNGTFFVFDLETGQRIGNIRTNLTDENVFHSDLVEIDGTFYGFAANVGNQDPVLFSYDLKGVPVDGTGIVQQQARFIDGLPANVVGGSGAGWGATDPLTGKPELYFVTNSSGNVYRIDDFDTDTPTGEQVTTGSRVWNNDGASSSLAFNPFATESRDTDGDGTPDYLDLDSDGDGFTDAQEGSMTLPGFASGTQGQADAFDAHTRGFFQILNTAVIDGHAYPAGQLFLVNPVDGGMTLVGDASNVGVRINGAGFDEATGFIYGVVHSEDPTTPNGGFDALGNELTLGDIVRYDRDGEVFKVADGDRAARSPSGDVYDGKLYLHDPRSGTFIVVDLETGERLGNIRSTLTDQNVAHADLVELNGTFYGFAANVGNQAPVLFSYDLTDVALDGTGVVQQQARFVQGLPATVIGGSGAGWAAVNPLTGKQELYFALNGTGDIYRVDNFDTDTPTAEFVGQGMRTGNNDGASSSLAFNPFASLSTDTDGDGIADHLDRTHDENGVSRYVGQGEFLWSETFGHVDASTTVVISEGQTVRFDQDAEINTLIVDGGTFLVDDNQDVNLFMERGLVLDGGEFRAGYEDQLHVHDFKIVLTGDNPDFDLDISPWSDNPMMHTIMNNDAYLMAMGMGSKLELHAADSQKTSWAQINATVEAGGEWLSFDEATGWEVGDRVAIASSSYDFNQAEERTIVEVSADGLSFRLDAPLAYRHYGEIETYDNGKAGAEFKQWDIDMRAEVGLLSRNITISGDENAHLDLYGGHTMVHHMAEMRLNGVEFEHMGQAGIVGRYAAHWHMLDDATGQYISNSSFHHTFNKGFTVHGTDNTVINHNVIYESIGHGVFLEDGSETGNLIQENLVFSTRAAAEGMGPIPTDETQVSSFWIDHPNNTLIGNHAAGSEKVAIWIFGPDAPLGDSTGQEVPGDFSDFVFRDNTVHSSGRGVFIDNFVDPVTLEVNGSRQIRNQTDPLIVEDTTGYKISDNSRGAIWVRTDNAHVKGFALADNHEGIFTSGSNLIEGGVIVARSEGNAEQVPETTPKEARGIRIYFHNQSAITDVHFEGFNQERDYALGVRLTAGAFTSYSQGLTFAETTEENRFAFINTVRRPADLDPEFDFDAAGIDNIFALSHNARIQDVLDMYAAAAEDPAYSQIDTTLTWLVDPETTKGIFVDLDGSLTGTAGTVMSHNDSRGVAEGRIEAFDAYYWTLDEIPTFREVLEGLMDWIPERWEI